MPSDKRPIYFIDSNVFLRVLVKEDETSFRSCVKLLEKVNIKKMQALTSDLVLAEVSWVLNSYYDFSKAKVISALEGIVNLTGLKIKNTTDISTAIDLYKNNKVKFIDALIASDKMFALNGIVISYDKDFDKLGIKRKEPDQII